MLPHIQVGTRPILREARGVLLPARVQQAREEFIGCVTVIVTVFHFAVPCPALPESNESLVDDVRKVTQPSCVTPAFDNRDGHFVL